MTSIYRINHSIALTSSQKDELANSLTQLHTATFDVPRLFAQIHFHSPQRRTASAKDPRLEANDTDHDIIYIGGRRRLILLNHVVAEIALPAGFGRTPSPIDEGSTSDVPKYESRRGNRAKDLLKAIVAIWKRVVARPSSSWTNGENDAVANQGDFNLHSCTIREASRSISSDGPAFFASYVAGITLPGPEEVLARWAEANLESYRTTAKSGKKRKRDSHSDADTHQGQNDKQSDEAFDRDECGTVLLHDLIADVEKKGLLPSAGPEDDERRKRRKEELEKAEQAQREKAMKHLEEMMGWGEAA
jgi:hypothetical protein